MEKRRIIFGDYNTAENGWTLTGWKLSDAEQKTNYVDKSSGDGSWDLSTAMTDGIARYKNRTLTATFECSEGDRLSREDKINYMINHLTGQRMNVILPDDGLHYVNGRLHVARDYNDLAHAKVTVTANCEPWRYANEETIVPAFLCGKNLFSNGKLVKLYGSGTDIEVISTGLRAKWTAGASGFQLFRLYPLDIIAGQTVTLSATMTAHGAGTPTIQIGYAAKSGSPRKGAAKLTASGSVTLKVEKLEGYDYLALWVYSNSGTPATSMSAGDYIDYTNIQVELGDTATAYSAYNKGLNSPKDVVLSNDRRAVCPIITVQDEVQIVDGANSYTLSEGVYQLPNILLNAYEERTLTVKGTGTAGFRYRKAVL